MNTSRVCLSLLLLTATAALAAEPEKAGGYELKNRSSFSAAPAARPPFWPIGWVKRKPEAGPLTKVPDAPKPQGLDEKNYTLTSVLLGPQPLANINGRSYAEGEYLRLPKGTPGPRVQVIRISDGKAELRSVDGQTLSIQIKRQVLESKPSEDDLLNGDR